MNKRNRENYILLGIFSFLFLFSTTCVLYLIDKYVDKLNINLLIILASSLLLFILLIPAANKVFKFIFKISGFDFAESHERVKTPTMIGHILVLFTADALLNFDSLKTTFLRLMAKSSFATIYLLIFVRNYKISERELENEAIFVKLKEDDSNGK